VICGTLGCAALVCMQAFAQPNLPPPPPPPMGQPGDVPPPPPQPTSPSPPSTAQPRPSAGRPPPPPPPAAARPGQRRREVHETHETVYVVEEPLVRPFALTFNPLAIIWGRLSANVELLLVPHHALVASVNLLLFNADRQDLMQDGFGFANRDSSGFGGEFGYHYWLNWHRSLRGLYLGPSLLLGNTSNAIVGDPTHAQGYWGLAFDLGGQEVLASGFTIGGGVGLGLVRMAGIWAGFPRALFQLGWSF
jgi:hypothetical protein